MSTQISIETNIKRDDIKTPKRIDDKYLVGTYHKNSWTWKRPQLKEKINPSELGTVYLFVDGMNGDIQNDTAATLATAAIQKHFENIESLPNSDMAINHELKIAFLEAHHAITEHSKKESDEEGIGTNAYVTWIIENKAFAAWNSLTHFYLLKGEKLEEQESDAFHIWSYIETDEEKKAKESHFCLGANEHPPKINTLKNGCIILEEDDRFLFCSHLYHEVVPLEKIEEIMKEDRKTENTPSTLIQAANDEGGIEDNSIWVIDIRRIKKKRKSFFRRKLVAPILIALAGVSLGFGSGFFYAKRSLSVPKKITQKADAPVNYESKPKNFNVSAAQGLSVANTVQSKEIPVKTSNQKNNNNTSTQQKTVQLSTSKRAKEMENKLIDWTSKKFRLLKKMNAFHEFLPPGSQNALKELEELRAKRTQLNSKLYKLIKVDKDNHPIYDKNNDVILRDDLPIKDVEQQFWRLHHELKTIENDFDDLCKRNYCSAN